MVISVFIKLIEGHDFLYLRDFTGRQINSYKIQ